MGWFLFVVIEGLCLFEEGEKKKPIQSSREISLPQSKVFGYHISWNKYFHNFNTFARLSLRLFYCAVTCENMGFVKGNSWTRCITFDLCFHRGCIIPFPVGLFLNLLEIWFAVSFKLSPSCQMMQAPEILTFSPLPPLHSHALFHPVSLRRWDVPGGRHPSSDSQSRRASLHPPAGLRRLPWIPDLCFMSGAKGRPFIHSCIQPLHPPHDNHCCLCCSPWNRSPLVAQTAV